MHPRKPKELIEEYAKKVGMPAEDLEIMVNAQFRQVKDIMKEFNDNMIYVPGLGIFFFRLWKIEDEFKKCVNILKAGNIPVEALRTVQELKNNLIRMDAIIMEEQSRRVELRGRLMEKHIGTYTEWKAGCRCEGCVKAKALQNKAEQKSRKERVNREKYRINRLYDITKGKTPKDMGEQG